MRLFAVLKGIACAGLHVALCCNMQRRSATCNLNGIPSCACEPSHLADCARGAGAVCGLFADLGHVFRGGQDGAYSEEYRDSGD